MRRKNGLVRLVEFVASNRLSEPAIRGIVTNFTDVTEQFDAERVLRNTEAKLRGLFESNVVNITFGDAKGQIHDANDAFLEMVGATRAALEAGELNWMTLTPARVPRDQYRRPRGVAPGREGHGLREAVPAPGRLAGVDADEPGEAAGHRR